MRAAARALDASVVVLDRGGQALAVAARSPADEQSLLLDAEGVTTIELRVADADVTGGGEDVVAPGQLAAEQRRDEAGGGLLRSELGRPHALDL